MWDPNILIAFRFPNSLPAVPTVNSGLQRRVIPELLKDVGAPFTNLFLTVTVKGVSSGPSRSGCEHVML